MGRVAGKVALVTGAAHGIGRAQAVRLAAEGAAVIAVDRCAPVDTVIAPAATHADLAETQRQVEAVGGRMCAVVADVRHADALRDAVDRGTSRFGGLDIVCATAGITPTGAAVELTEDAWQTMLDVNLTGVWQTCKAAAPHLIRRGAGSMILTNPVEARRGPTGVAHYVAAKHGVVGLMRAMSKEFSAHNIRVNSVHPANGDTPMIQPIDVANATLFLASDEARYITAVTLPVDGGNTQR